KTTKNWSYAEAEKTVAYVRGCLGDLRIGIIRLRHLLRAHKLSRKSIKGNKEIEALQDLGKKTFAEFDGFGIIIFDKSYRGVAL
ncbi:hypothetical protein ACSTLO_00730, partial [Vibrio parahaemolyticus]